MILTYRLINGIEDIDYRNLFTLSTNPPHTRGNSLKIAKPKAKLNVRRYSFAA